MKTEKCRWKPDCPYPALRALARRVKKLAEDLGPIGLHKRWWSAKQEARIGLPTNGGEQAVTEFIYRGDIEGVDEAYSSDPDIVVDDLRRRIDASKSSFKSPLDGKPRRK